MKWFNTWTRDYGVQYCEVIITAMSEGCDSVASVIKKGIFYPQKGNEASYILEEDNEKLNSVVDKLLNDETTLRKEIELFNKHGKEYVENAKKISEMNLKEMENEKLLEIYEKFRGIWINYTSYLWTMFHSSVFFCQKAEKLLSEKAKGVSNESFGKLVSFASTPSEEASILKLNRKLIELKKLESSEEFEKILNEFRWIPCLDLHNKPWTREDLIEYSKNYTPPKESKISEEEMIREFKLNEDELKTIRLNKELAHIRDVRDEYRRIGIYHIQKLYEEIGKRMNLSLKEMSFVRDEEIKEFLKYGKIPDRKIIEERPKGFLMFKEENGWTCIIGEEIKEKAKELGYEEEETNEETVEGKIASKGKVRGKVKVILTAKDLNKVSEGDVLVSVTTGPDYVPAMHKACAFVTDEGGLTCHAAIVSREMGKPCIVGTGNATRVLNDGDIVEVDCETGTVKKI